MSKSTLNQINFLLKSTDFGSHFESDLSSSSVNAYRARAANEKIQFQNLRDYFYPKYSSFIPLPKKISGECNLSFDESFQFNISNLSLNTKKNTTANDLLSKALNIVHSTMKPDTFILKVKDAEEYLKGSDLIWRSSHVRALIRRRRSFRLIAIEDKSDLKAQELFQTDLDLTFKEYTEKVPKDEFQKILKKNDFSYGQWKGKEIQNIEYIPLAKLNVPFNFKIISCENLEQLDDTKMSVSNPIFFKTFLFYGSVMESETVFKTSLKMPSKEKSLWWNEPMRSKAKVLYPQLPRETKLAVLLCQRKTAVEKNILAWSILPLIDENGRLLSGRKSFVLYPAGPEGVSESSVFRGPVTSHLEDREDSLGVIIEFESFILPVFASRILDHSDFEPSRKSGESPFNDTKVLSRRWFSGVYNEKKPKKEFKVNRKDLWDERISNSRTFEQLPLLLQCIDWKDPGMVHEMHKLLKIWQKPTFARDAICLLDYSFHDTAVRDYAVELIGEMQDEELDNFIIQIVQAIKLENYHDSSIVRLLVSRACGNPHKLGTSLFWSVLSEIDVPDNPLAMRFHLILEELLYRVGSHCALFFGQKLVIDKFCLIATEVHGYEKDKDVPKYHSLLDELNENFFADLPKKYFQLMFDSSICCEELITSKCRYMDSKKKPLWLSLKLKNSEESRFAVFKKGDDLRQDVLTLQLLHLMDQIWLSEGLDLKLTPYRVISTGYFIGMIEAVMEAETISKIQIKYGGGAVGAFKAKTIENYLIEHNPESVDYENAQSNFLSSCAGYCVATYALGIADRHSSNIMLTKNGNLFHIDFGHFLGNFKTKMGVLRERSPFVFTPEMAYVMGGKQFQSHHLFQKFKAMCNKAFLILRKHYKIFVDLLHLMIPAQIPELTRGSDIEYFTNILALHQSDEEAQNTLQKAIQDALTTTSRKLDNLIHNIKHG